MQIAKANTSARIQDRSEGSKRQRTGAEAKEDLRAVKAAHWGSLSTNGEVGLWISEVNRAEILA